MIWGSTLSEEVVAKTMVLAQIAQQLDQAEARQAHHQAQHHEHEEQHRDVEQRHQHAQLLERAYAVLAHGEGDGAQHAQRCQLDDDAHDLEQGHGQGVHQLGDGLAALAQHGQRAAEQHGEQQHLQHVALGEGFHHGGGNELHQEVHRAAAGQLVGIAGIGRHGRGVELAGVHVHAHAGLEDKGQHQAHAQGDGGQHLEIDQGLDAHAADALEVACTGNAVHDHAEHQYGDDHLDELDEAIAQGFEFHGPFRGQ
jgi:hypothetical protein